MKSYQKEKRRFRILKGFGIWIGIWIWMFLILIFGASSASAGWTTGKYNSAIDFNGTTTYIDGFGAIGNINTVSFWIKADDLSKSIIDLNGTQTITVSAGTILANNFTSPTIYVDGKVSSILPDTNWHYIAITTATNISASAVVIGKVSTNYFDGTLDEVRLYNYVRAADEIRLDYQAGYAIYLGPSGKTCSEDPASCMDYGLAGYWNMDEGGGQIAKDLSGNGNNGALTNGPLWTKGKKGGGLKFDGKNDYVEITPLSFTSNYTVAMWVYPFDILNFRGLFGNMFSGSGWTRFMSSTAQLSYMNDANTQIVFGTNWIINTWNYIVLSEDENSNVTLYMNGAKKNTQNLLGTKTIRRLGNYGHITVGSFNGSIDEVRIYNRALSAEEVRYHYNRGGPVAEWKFDEGSGQKVYDSSGNADGQLGSDSLPAGDANDPGWSVP